MAKKHYDGHRTWATGDDLSATFLNAWSDGLQDEFEERLERQTVSGVISGLTPSTSDANSVAIAAGEGYAGGDRFEAAGGVDFSASDAATTWYIIFDKSGAVFGKTTTAPTQASEDCYIASYTWDGGTDLSAGADIRRWGIVAEDLQFFEPGTVATGTHFFGIAPRDMWIEDVQIALTDNGSAGTTIVDAHAGTSAAAIVTIFTTQTRRPELAHATTDRTVATSGEPESSTRKLSAGDIFELIVDTAATGAQDLCVSLRVRYY